MESVVLDDIYMSKYFVIEGTKDKIRRYKDEKS